MLGVLLGNSAACRPEASLRVGVPSTGDQWTYTLHYAARPPIMSPSIPDPPLLRTITTASGATLDALAARGPLVLVFLRHFGCPLCQEMVADVAARRAAMTASGTTVVFVHMHPEPQAAAFFARFGVQDLERVSDPARTLYRAFGVPRATPSSWFHPGTWASYFRSIVRGHHRPGYVGGDVGQASGVVRLVDGRVERVAVPAGMTERADFDDLLACPVQPAARPPSPA
jgi:peroxiredoxin